MRKRPNHLIVLVFLVVHAVVSVGCGDRETVLVIELPTEVRRIEPSSASPASSNADLGPGQIITTLKAGETATATGVYHGQDHDGFKVKLADGTEGLILAGDTFKVVAR